MHRRAMKQPGAPPQRADSRLYIPALPEMVESDAYQVALVPRGEWDHLRESPAEPVLLAASPVLLPFSLKELVVSVSELAKDPGSLPEHTLARFADICVDFTRMEVRRSSGEPITLTTQEFRTLKCFLSNPERVLSRAELLNQAWGYEHYPSTRTVDNHVLRLRQKLERDPARPVHFRTVRRIGYRFVP